MRLNPYLTVFVFYTASCRCGVIDDVLLAKRLDRGKRAAAAEGAVNYDERPEVGGGEGPGSYPQMHDPNAVAESLELPSAKHKRCPSLQQRLGVSHDISRNQIVGAMTPLGIQRRDIQSDLLKRLCNTCMARLQCKTYNKCDQCKRWCIEKDPSSNDITDESIKDTSNTNTNGIENSDVKISLPNRFGGVSVEDQSVEDTRVSLPAPGGLKRIFTIANFSSGPLKEIICKLLGIFDTTDIDKMVVWVTTHSNEPPKFTEGYKKNVSPLVEKLTDVLNGELKRTMDRNKKQGRNYLTNTEMEEIAKKVLADHSSDIRRPGGESNSISEGIKRIGISSLPRVNPDLIQDTVDPRLLENWNEEFPTAPRFGSNRVEAEGVSGDGTVGMSEAEVRGTQSQVQSAQDQGGTFLSLPKPDDAGDESQSEADAREPNRFVTKKLMQQVKDRMNQRLKYPEQLYPDTLSGKMKIQDSALAVTEDDQVNSKSIESEIVENANPSLQSIQTPEEHRDNIIDLSIAEKGPNPAQDIIQEQQEMEPRKGELKPDGLMMSSPDLEEGGLKSEDPMSKPTETLPSFNKLKDVASTILQNLKKGTSNMQKIDNFDTAKAVLKNVENIVGEIEKETHMKPDEEQIDTSRLRMENEGKNFLTPSENLENTANVAHLHPTDLVGLTSEKKIKEQPQVETDKLAKWKLYDKEKLGVPQSQTVEPDSDRLGSQPIENVIWDKDMLPRTFQGPSQRRYKDWTKLGSTNVETSPIEGDTPAELMNHNIPVKFPAQIMTVRGKEIPMKQKTKVEISPHDGPHETVGEVSSKYEETNSGYRDNESLGASGSLQETVGGVDSENNILKQTDNRFTNIVPDSQQPEIGSDSEISNIPEAIDSRFKNIDDSTANTASGLQEFEIPPVGSALGDQSWSNSLGALIPLKKSDISVSLSPKDMYFIGNGIKLPLQMVRNDDGALHLSVDLDKLCSCKNNTVCPKNHTGGILGNQAVVGNLLGDSNLQQMSSHQVGDGNMRVSVSAPKFQEEPLLKSNLVANRNGRGTGSKWLDTKNSIASQLDPHQEYAQREVNIFKRSTEKTAVKETSPERITMPITGLTENEHKGNSVSDNSPLEYTQDNGSPDSLDTFQEFLNEKLTNLKSKMKDIERRSEMKSQQSEGKLINVLNAINKNTKVVTNEIGDRNVKEKQSDEREASPKSLEIRSRILENLTKKQRGNELFDIVTPIKGVYKFKKAENLQNKLEKINEYIDQYAKENENLLKKEAELLSKTQKNSFIKKEVDIVSSVLNFLKTLATDNK